MKKYFLLLLCIQCLALSACFSPLGYKNAKESTLRVKLPGREAAFGRTLLDTEDLRYELDFSGPAGKTINKTARLGDTVVVRVEPGVWNIVIWAYKDNRIEGSDRVAFGEMYGIEVGPGMDNRVTIKMAVYTEVENWEQLFDAVTEGVYDELIVIQEDITVSPIT